jgi:hypothetical protein
MSNLSQIFSSDTTRLQGRVYQLLRAKGRVAALIKKESFPTGIGYSPITVNTLRSNPVGGSGWVTVAQEDGTANNCQVDPSVVTPALSTISYTIEQQMTKSATICLTDARFGYMFQEQVKNNRENFVSTIVDTWEDRSKYWYQYWAAHKIINNSSQTEGSGTAFPNTAATYIASQEQLDPLWTRIMQDGGGEEPYAMSNGAACIPAIMSPEAHRNIIKGSSSVREDFRFAQMGKGYEGAQLLQSWGVDKPYGGFMHVIDYRMPRYNFTGGAYVEVPYYTTAAATIGTQTVLNPDYESAGYEVIYLFHPEAVIRQTPTPMGSVGADTKFLAANYNGDIIWRNIPNETTNLFENQGVWAAQLMAAWKPTAKRNYAYALMVKRCPTVVGTECAY